MRASTATRALNAPLELRQFLVGPTTARSSTFRSNRTLRPSARANSWRTSQKPSLSFSSVSSATRFFSSVVLETTAPSSEASRYHPRHANRVEHNNNNNNNNQGPKGTLFTRKIPVGPDLIGATASIQRTFGPRSNAEGLLAVGGAELAAQSSFDPNYMRAQEWIRHHAVGPARLSPILIAGLTGALTEAAFPHAIVVGQAVRHVRPLIVGVPVTASIQVLLVQQSTRPVRDEEQDDHHPPQDDKVEEGLERKWGYNVTLKTAVTRVRDDAVIAQGTHELWVPDYLKM